MIRAVLDTNVLASAIAGEALVTSTPGKLFRYWRRRGFDLILSDHILNELDHTLGNPYFRGRLTPDQTKRALRALRIYGRVVAITATVSGEATHPEDDLILATAISARADFLVTGDRQLQALGRVRDVAVVDPKAFLLVLERFEDCDRSSE